jgi:hypothetical protein
VCSRVLDCDRSHSSSREQRERVAFAQASCDQLLRVNYCSTVVQTNTTTKLELELTSAPAGEEQGDPDTMVLRTSVGAVKEHPIIIN